MRTTYLVCYDICHEKRLRKVFKTCRNYRDHVQYSIVECDLTQAERIRLATCKVAPRLCGLVAGRCSSEHKIRARLEQGER